MTKPATETSIPFWRSHLLSDEPGLVHAVTRRGWNMAEPAGRREVCRALTLDFDRLTVAEQVHGTAVAMVAGGDAGRGGRDRASRLAGVDGLITELLDTPLLVLSADCALLMVYDRTRPALGVAHSGWRGTAAGMARALVAAMASEFGSRPASLSAVVSACAGGCCYEVGDDAVETMRSGGLGAEANVVPRNGRLYFDLAGANVGQLLDAGLAAERVERAGECTICHPAYYSFRRERTVRGQFGLLAALRGNSHE